MNAENPAGGPQSPAGPQSPGPQAPDPQASPPPPPPQSPQSPQAPAGAALAAPVGGSLELCSVGKRFGAYVLDIALAIVTLGIGWLIWTLIILGRGQTPGKQLMHMRIVDADSGQLTGYGKMFVREFPAKFVIGLAATFSFGLGLILYFWLCWDNRNQELWDKMCNTVVVDDPNDTLAPVA